MQQKRKMYIDVKKRISNVALIFSFIVVSVLCSQRLTAQIGNTTNDGNLYKDFKTEFMWDAKVKITGMINVGESKRGVRRVIPITGGTFSGPKIKGEVLSGGEDWQLVRPDGGQQPQHGARITKHGGPPLARDAPV